MFKRIITHFRQWVAHRMASHWRKKTLALRKRQNLKGRE